MKHLLLIFGILILRCTTDIEVDERLSPVVEEPAPVAEEPRPAVADNLAGKSGPDKSYQEHPFRRA